MKLAAQGLKTHSTKNDNHRDTESLKSEYTPHISATILV